MDAIEELETLTKEAAQATASVLAKVAACRVPITTMKGAITNLLRAPLPDEEIEARFRAAVARDGAGWLRDFGRQLVTGERSFGTFTPRFGQPDFPFGWHDHSWGFMCAAEPERVIANLMAVVHQVGIQAGPPAAERPALLESERAELAAFEAAEEQIVDAAIAAGVTLEHRPEVTRRRADEARAREIEAQAVVNRAARQAALDAAHEDQPRGLPSPYIGTPGNTRMP